ncbi:hypothetical protein [Wenjunlia vitaminophila]|uniref:hypothetical protein n=1 Tax=Wenjunlia vitaminophila TaxID=76728 RepID=UPI00036777F3|nr:hypothetical protein [Wenjunlia vitaminophila]
MAAPVGSVDVEVLLIDWLQGRLGAGVVVRDELDNRLLEELPTVQVEELPGTDDGLRLSRAMVDINVYAASRQQARDLAAQVHRLLLGALRGSATDAAVVGRVAAVTTPAPRPYENTALRRRGATYEIYLHPVH